MEKKIIQYSIIKILYDRTGNILESFYPFFLNSLENDKLFESIDCQSRVKKKFDLDIPIHVLQRLARIAHQKQHITITDDKRIWPIRITEDGMEKKDTLIDPEDSERKINQLVIGFVKYLEEIGISETNENVRGYIENYIKKNILKLSDFFFEHTNPDTNCFEDHEKEFTQYILKIEKENPEEYSTLKEMLYGSIISSSLNLPQTEFEGVVDSKFKKTKVFFDANYLFSLLEFHDEELSRPAKELYNLLVKYGFDLRYYDFTLSEMTHVLSNFMKNYNTYPSGIKIKSLFSVLKRKKMKPSDVIDLISNLENRLEKLKIYKKNTDINLDKYTPVDSSISSKLRKAKPKQSEFYHQHDLALLEKAKKLRKKRYHNFEEANNFVITSDYKLGLLCYNLFNHGQDKSISEVVLDRTFTNILFLKDPSIDLSLSTIISGFSSELFVKRSVWEKFYILLKELKSSGEISDDKISNLFYHGYIEKELLNCEDTDVDSIDEAFVLSKIEEATENKEKDIEQNLKEIQTESERLVESIEEEKQRELDAKDMALLLRIDTKSRNDSNTIIFLVRLIMFILIITPVIFEGISWYQNGIFNTTAMSILRYIVFAFSTCFISIPQIIKSIKNFLYEKRKNYLTKIMIGDDSNN